MAIESTRPPALPPNARASVARLGGGLLRVGSRAAVTAVHCVVLTGWLHPSHFWVMGAVFAGVMALAPWLSRRLGRAPAARIAAIGTVWLLVVGYWRSYAYFADPRGSLLTLALLPGMFVLERVGWLGRWSVLPVAVLVGWQARVLPAPLLGRLVAGCALPLADQALCHPPLFRRMGRGLTASFVTLIATLASAAGFYYAPGTPDRAPPQPGVSVVLATGSETFPSGTQFYSVVPDCTAGQALVQVHKSPQGHHLLDLASGRTKPWLSIRDPADNVLFLCDRDELVAGDWSAAKTMIFPAHDLGGATPLRGFDGLSLGPGRFVASPDRELLWYLDAAHMTIRVAELATGRILAESKRFAGGLAALGGDRAVTASEGEWHLWRVVRTVPTPEDRSCDVCTGRLELERSAPLEGDWNPVSWAMPNLFPNDTVGTDERVFVSSVQQGSVHAIDLATLREVARVELGTGIRHMTYAPRHDLVAVSGWTTGRVFLLRGRDLSLVRIVDVGARPRIVSFDEDERFAWVGSGAGVVRIEVPPNPAQAGPGPREQ